jgi:phage gp46-like protein
MDIAIVFNGHAWTGDLLLDPWAGLGVDRGLATAVIVSLFSDRRARQDDRLPGGADDRRGWWGDAMPPRDGTSQVMQGDRIGSRLWLLEREKVTRETLARAKDYVAEAVAWMVRDGLARRIDVETWADGQRLCWRLEVHRPDGAADTMTFAVLWRGQEEAGHAV